MHHPRAEEDTAGQAAAEAVSKMRQATFCKRRRRPDGQRPLRLTHNPFSQRDDDPTTAKTTSRHGDINGSGPLEAENIRGHGGDFLPGIELQTSWSSKVSLVGLGADREFLYIEA